MLLFFFFAHTIEKENECKKGEKKMNTKELLYYNGFGGFTKDGREYVIQTNEDFTPLPWSHIMANESFGCLVTASGGGYIWSGNSRENKITVWSNDFVEDPPSEKLWLEEVVLENQNEEKKRNPYHLLPYESLKNYIVTFGFGYAMFEKEADRLKTKTTIFVPRHEKKKVYQIDLKNSENKTKTCEFHYQIKPVLGVNREDTKKHLIISRKDDRITIQNYHRESYAEEVVYIQASQKMETVEIVEKTISLSFSITLAPLEEKKILLEVGIAGENDILCQAEEKLQEVKDFWSQMTAKVKVKTPVESMNILLNGWLFYQTVVSRLWGRCSFYQAGGAFGFRDQLQDQLIMLYYDPSIARKQILYHAKHQFKEGDVLHWWHPEKDNGIRTRYSDDLLWLPYILCEYVEKTKDFSILSEEVPFVQMEKLTETENERYANTTPTEERESVYLHAKRAIDKSLSFGPHGLPKMGSGDWNDGMNQIGGESVWLGFFLYEVLKRFCKLCEITQDQEQEKYLAMMECLRSSLNQNAWDGAWYRRAYYPDGAMVGSHESEECKIDFISQSWSVLSEAGDSEKTKSAMKSAENYLVDSENRLIKLLTPAFHLAEKNPGYIKCYLPGVRENGGQYTHGAVWSILAEAKLHHTEKAVEYFCFLNPIEHARTKESALIYQVEPYVVAADIYAANGMVGRGRVDMVYRVERVAIFGRNRGDFGNLQKGR